MRKKTKAPTCSWCGTKLRGRRDCPRGPACAQEQRNHDDLMGAIEKGAKRG